MRIKVIIPNSNMSGEVLKDREIMLSSALSSDCGISVECISEGPESIESNTDEILASKALLMQSVRAQEEGFDAIVVYCFSDLAVNALRENLNIPVVGPGEVTICAAGMLSVKFSVITTSAENLPRTLRRLSSNAICRDKMVSVIPLNIPVLKLRDDSDVTIKYLEKACRKAKEEDKADTVVLGCLGFAQYGQAIAHKLGITVLDPAFISVACAEMCVRLGLKHNNLAYPFFRGNIYE